MSEFQLPYKALPHSEFEVCVMVTLLTWTLMISVIFTVVRCSCFHVFRLSKTS